MVEPTLRLHLINEAGAIIDAGQSYRLSEFAGFLPAPGDRIVRPGAETRAPGEVLEVVGRVFNPRGLRDYVALVCRVRAATAGEAEVMLEDEEAPAAAK